MSMQTVKNTCEKHPERDFKYMSIGGFKIPYCIKCHEPKKKMTVAQINAMKNSARFQDKQAIKKEVWKDKQTWAIGGYSKKKRFDGGGKDVKPVFGDSHDRTNKVSGRKIKGFK